MAGCSLLQEGWKSNEIGFPCTDQFQPDEDEDDDGGHGDGTRVSRQREAASWLLSREGVGVAIAVHLKVGS